MITAGLAEFAQAHALRFAEGGSLPATGGVLSRDSLVVHATAEGELREGAEGTLALLTYTYGFNDTTRTRHLTAAVIRVPESIAFAPYLADSSARLNGVHAGMEAKAIELDGGAEVYAEVGIDEAWLWTIGINVIGAGIFGLLLNLSNPLIAVLIFELVVISVAAFLSIRSEINGRSKKLAAEVFWREYARARALEPIDARTFAATHAKAGLRSAPDRVLVGNIGGVDGALALKGEGLKRGDWIGIVAGPAGPVASADLELSAPGPAATALDACVERLGSELSAQR